MAGNATNVSSLTSLIAAASTNPQLLVAVVLQLLLGFAAGYYMAKIAKYIIALIGVFLLGTLIGVWGASGSVNDLASRIEGLAKFKDLILNAVKMLGFIAVGPTSIGFIIGIIVGVTRK
ncbi:hypothetical protein CF15_00320 [Pyrodictium occultum]|uniref:FUN14 family protein n=1 Tax=Pyrodictium occultum TaxID=2309 RepID=A0A0V8RTP0_PYROC|nr:hypothetical protein [Pyrodictium occultum]KSW11352.1 hypothetical protein CF15_00320 [Pyrodictium occultum]